MKTRLDSIRIVLVAPSHPGNIGSAARAMKTMGLSRLVLVRPKRFPDPEADALSSNAREVLAAAEVVDSLDEALRGVALAVAAVSHAYELSHAMVTCREAAGRAVALGGEAAAAFVFGTEASGLTAEQVLRCHLAAHIPSNPEYTSLNLAAAVQIFAYELRLAALGAPGVPPGEAAGLASDEDIERLHCHLADTLATIGFLDPAHPKRLLPRLRRIVAKARLDPAEVRILRGLLKSAQRFSVKAGREPTDE